MNKKEFIDNLKKINISLTQEQIDKLEIYKDFLIEYNKHTNLTAITNEDDIYLKHFYDSLTLTQAIDLTEVNSLIDIGTGAGFPGMVIKIIFPDINVTLLDSNGKKIEFLKELIKKLQLEKITIINSRAEEYIKNNRESFDIVTARAVSNMSILTEICLPFVKINGYFIAMKGSNEEEIIESEKAINTLGGSFEKNIKFSLPIENSIRQLVIIKKIKNTPLEYPRSYEKIKKKPLKNKNK